MAQLGLSGVARFCWGFVGGKDADLCAASVRSPPESRALSTRADHASAQALSLLAPLVSSCRHYLVSATKHTAHPVRMLLFQLQHGARPKAAAARAGRKSRHTPFGIIYRVSVFCSAEVQALVRPRQLATLFETALGSTSCCPEDQSTVSLGSHHA
eukprot:2704452-Rhodomonas_salina.1